jgi:hypothetical protein
MWQALVYAIVTTTLWVIGRVEDTRTKKIKKSDIDIRDEIREAGEGLADEGNSKKR